MKPISREEATEITKEFFHAFPDLTHNLEESIAVEDKVIIRLTAQGTHEGEFLGIPATGKKIVFSAITILRFEDGKVIEERQEVDMLGFFQQLGMELKPKETEK